MTEQRWRLRTVPDELVQRYLAEGWWTDAGLGTMVADGLGAMGHAGFRVGQGPEVPAPPATTRGNDQ